MFKIVTDGKSYSDGIPLDSAVLILENFGKIYASSLTEACLSLKISPSDTPNIKLESAQKGSGIYDLILNGTAIVLPMLPQVYATAWTCLKNAYVFIQTLNDFKKKNGTPMTIHIDNSPGATVYVSGRDTIVVPQPAFNVAKASLKAFSEIAKAVQADTNAHATTYYSQFYDDRKSITNENADDFISKDFSTVDEKPVELEANIYKLNKKTLNGTLEFSDGEQTRAVAFTADKDMSVLAAIALASERCNITATPERHSNILGESRIVRFHITDITIPKA
ncbi:MAG: hypothetical protein EOM10_00350 [Opitutae bacterium]|nr:hypothetical protein [Opitutae bacterium]